MLGPWPCRTAPAQATFADLAALDDAVEAEIVGGELVQRANPTMAHGRSQLALGGALRRRYDRRPGGRWPGGWWFGTEVDVEYGPHDPTRRATGSTSCECCTPPGSRTTGSRTPEDHTLVVHRWEPAGYLIALTATGREVVRAEPFEAVELSLGVLFGVVDDED
jgi:hypothetical protein